MSLSVGPYPARATSPFAAQVANELPIVPRKHPKFGFAQAVDGDESFDIGEECVFHNSGDIRDASRASRGYAGYVPLLRETARAASMWRMDGPAQIDVPKFRRAILAWLEANPKDSRRSLSIKASGGKSVDLVRDTFRVDKRVPSFDTIVKLSRTMGRDAAEFISLSAPASAPSDAWLRVYGPVEAGVWREQCEWPVEDQFEVETSAGEPFPGATGLVVRGRSMERTLPPGTYLKCVPLIGSGLEIQDEDYVIVERLRNGLREVTCKRLERLRDGNWQLVAESNLPEFSEPIFIGKPITEGDDLQFDGLNADETRVTALVVDAYLPLARRGKRPVSI
jgi:hypothetical protein